AARTAIQTWLGCADGAAGVVFTELRHGTTSWRVCDRGSERDHRRHTPGSRQYRARGRRGGWGLACVCPHFGSAWHGQRGPREFCEANRGERNRGRPHLQLFAIV